MLIRRHDRASHPGHPDFSSLHRLGMVDRTKVQYSALVTLECFYPGSRQSLDSLPGFCESAAEVISLRQTD